MRNAPPVKAVVRMTIAVAVSVLTHFAKSLPAMTVFKTETKLPSIVVATVMHNAPPVKAVVRMTIA
jgi:hypothetical protein